MQEGSYPVSGLSMDSIIFEFTEQAFMWDTTKRFQEIEQNEVNLQLIIDGFAPALNSLYELHFTWQTKLKAMLKFKDNLELVKVSPKMA